MRKFREVQRMSRSVLRANLAARHEVTDSKELRKNFDDIKTLAAEITKDIQENGKLAIQDLKVLREHHQEQKREKQHDAEQTARDGGDGDESSLWVEDLSQATPLTPSN